MRIFLLLTTFFAFLQSAFLTLNVVLIIIAARSLVVDDKENLILAFFGGLILSLLTQVNLGYWPIVFILVVKLGQILRKLPVSFNALMVLATGSLQILLVVLLNKFFLGERIDLLLASMEAFLVVPVYFIVKGWEERFVTKNTIRLKYEK